MAEVIVLYAPRDTEIALAAITGLSKMRTLLVPLTPRAQNYRLGARMVRVVIWSAIASEAGVAEVVTEYGSRDAAPMVVALCDDTPPPEALTQAARATIAVSDNPASQAELAAAVQSVFDAELRHPVAAPGKLPVVKHSILVVVIAAILALGVAAGVSALAPHFAPAQGPE